MLLCERGAAMAGVLTDFHFAVGREFVGRHFEILRRRTLANAAGGIVLRAVAGAEPATEIAARIGRFLSQRHAAKMRADADDDEPFRFFYPRRIGLRIAQDGYVDALGPFDLLGGAVVDEDRL